MSTDLAVYKREATEILNDLKDREIFSDEENAICGELLKFVKGRLAFLKIEKEKILKPQKAAVEATRDLFNQASAPFEEAEALLKARMAAFFEERKAKETKLLSEALESDSPRELVDLAAQAAPVVQGVSMREVYDFVVEDASLVPDEYKLVSIDTKKIGLTVKAKKDLTSIPGVRVFKKTIVASRGS